MRNIRLFLLFLFIALMLLEAHGLTVETDRKALLDFKSQVSGDVVLSSWNNSFHVCNWRGVSCGLKHKRVTRLDLGGLQLGGVISPYIGLRCSEESPTNRLEMSEARKELISIRERFFKARRTARACLRIIKLLGVFLKKESMGPKAGTLVILLLGLTLLSDATSFLHSSLGSEEVSKNEKVCTLCEEYVNVAISYLEKNETQAQIIEDLHDRCSHMRGFAQQCKTLVDYYVPLFFIQLETFQPEDFCKRMNLCDKVAALVEEARQDTCGVCHKTVSEILIKLQDPDTQLDIVQLLLKGCKSFKNYEKKCKRLVFEYGPLILVNANDFLVKNDVCTLLRACPAENTVSRQPGSADS